MRSTPKIGFRREVLILVPTSLLVLIVLALFTLLSYRGALDNFLEAAHEEATRSARLSTSRLARDGTLPRSPPEPEMLRSLAAGALGAALLDAEGERLAYVGDLPSGNLLRDLGATSWQGAAAFGPSRAIGERIVAVAPFGPPDDRRYLRLDFPDRGLQRQQRNADILAVLVVCLSLGVAVLSGFFLRYLLAPLDTLLERARAAVPTAAVELDDIPFLLETFDEALGALTSQPAGGDAPDDMHLLGRALTPAVDCGLLLVDPEGRVLALNQLGAQLLALPGPATPGDDYTETFKAVPELLALVARVLTGGLTPAPSELTLERDGESRTLGLAVHELRREGREPQGLLFLFADRTELRRREERERLSRSLAQMGELTAGIAHELRNSLTSLRGYLTLAQKRAGHDETLSGDLAEMRHEADHVQRILDDFLSFARPGSVRLERLQLEAIVDRAAADASLAGKQVRLSSNAEAHDPPQIWGDPLLLERALRNLLQNAAEAEQEAGHQAEAIEVAIEYESTGVVLQVDDRGPGVDPSMSGKLFVPFSTNKAQGVGLGLALARRILELHHASLELSDRAEGGARARIRFPATSLVVASTEAQGRSSSGAG
jgi:signal transduction histidine kinase